jgi:hypothetical protein
MNITLVSTPAAVIATSPEAVSRWLATESPNNFRLQRKDWLIVASEETTGSPAGCMQFTTDEAFTGDVGDAISVHNVANDAMYTGTVTGVDGTTVQTDIPYAASFSADFLNDDTMFNGFYFEGRLTINDVLQTLTVIASPNSFGIADIDVSGILRISTALDKVGDYSTLVMAETNKSGKFTFEYRPCWYGSAQPYIAEGNTWYYAECVRSVEQGSNLADFVYSPAGDAPFLCSFDQPIYFAGLPFDLSFICPVLSDASPAAQLRVTLQRYSADNSLLSETVTLVDPAGLEGRVCSLLIDPVAIEENAAYITAKIELA